MAKGAKIAPATHPILIQLWTTTSTSSAGRKIAETRTMTVWMRCGS